MAVGAEVFLVAVGAELRVVGRDGLVALDEVRRVLGVVQPARRLEGAAGEHRLDRGAAVAAEVAGVAGALGLALRSRVGHLVAVEAAAHARELVARRELELVDRAVALGAADVPVGVRLVVEEQVRARQAEGRDGVPSPFL